MEDASIRIKVKIDNSVAEKDLNKLNQSIDRTAANIEKAMGQLAKNPATGVEKAADVFKQIDQQAESAELTIADMRAKLAEVADQRINTEAYQQVENEITKCDKKMEELIAKQNKMDALGVKENSKQYKNLQYEIDATAEKLDKLYARKEDLMARGADSIRVGDTEGFAQREAQVAALEAKQSELNRTTQEYGAAVEDANKNLPKGKGFGASLDSLGNSFHSLTKKVIKYGTALLGARGAMGILRKAVNSYMQTNTDCASSIKNAWAVIGEMIGPVIEWLVGLIAKAITWINAFVYALTGINFVARANAKALNKQAGATTKAAKAQERLQQASFDEQNVLSDDSSDAGGGAGGGAGGFNIDSSIRDGIENEIAKISAIVGAATLAIGAILCLTGVNIPLGIALMAIGALELAAAHKIAWNSMDKRTKKTVSRIEAILGGAALAVGAILAFTGVNIPLGIALLAIGAASLVASASLDWDKTGKNVKTVLEKIGLAVGAALLAIGAVLLFSGAGIPLGLGLIAAGAVSLTSQLAPSWSKVPNKVKETISTISKIAGAALLVLGVILLFTGAGIPLGLGLLAAGGTSLAASIKPDWSGFITSVSDAIDKAKKKFNEKLDDIKNQFKSLPDKLRFASNAWQNCKDYFSNRFEDMKQRAYTKLDNLRDRFKSLPDRLRFDGSKFSDLKTKMTDYFQTLRERAGGKLDELRDKFNGLPGKLKISSWQDIRNKIQGVFSNMGSTIADRISTAFKNVLNKIISKAESKINSGVNLINKCIDLANKLPGVSVGHVNTVSLPRLARGAIVNNPGRGVPAVIGEAGREAVLPLERNTGWMDMLADKINGKNKTGQIVIPIYLGSRKIAEEVVNIQEAMAFAKGV